MTARITRKEWFGYTNPEKMLREMGEILKENKDSIVRWLSVILTLLFYWFGVVKNNEKTRVEVLHLQAQITAIDSKMQRLDDVKADKEILNMLMNSINRIESKLDRMSEK